MENTVSKHERMVRFIRVDLRDKKMLVGRGLITKGNRPSPNRSDRTPHACAVNVAG